MSDVLERVRKGAQLLDTESPGWAAKIDIERLDMQYGDVCIRGQVYGDYSDSLEDFDMSYQDAYDFGFTVLPEAEYLDYTIPGTPEAWSDLRSVWLTEIAARS